MKPFLLLQSRPEDVASDNEYEAFCAFGELLPHQLRRIRMDKGEFPKVDLSDYAGIIMGGGPANFAYRAKQKSAMQKAFEPWLFALLDEIITTDTPYFGACLGFGALVKALNGKIDFDHAEPVVPMEMTKTPEGCDDLLLRGIPETFEAFVGHKEGTDSVPEGAVALVRSETCLQMIRAGKNVYATQFHPELDGPGLALRIQVYGNAGYFAPSEADALTTMALTADVPHPVRILQKFTERYSYENRD